MRTEKGLASVRAKPASGNLEPLAPRQPLGCSCGLMWGPRQGRSRAGDELAVMARRFGVVFLL